MVFAAESKPTGTSTKGFKSDPSIPAGTVTTAVAQLFAAKNSASSTASVAVRVPPTSTSPLKPRLLQTSMAFFFRGSSLAKLSLLRPSRSKPPVRLWAAASSGVISTQCSPKKPSTPPTNPSSLAESDPPLQRLTASPCSTSCPPGAGRPQNTSPTFFPPRLRSSPGRSSIRTKGWFTRLGYAAMIRSWSTFRGGWVSSPTDNFALFAEGSETTSGRWLRNFWKCDTLLAQAL
mmetsp:Transcript_19908/g.48412  ORF Transcript_19908/g.48412 Transcript_19908/m.48412 type:complete len:233 (-) Transcript_19908:1792-2490(-)